MFVTREIQTVKQLRAYLDEMEQQWDDQSNQYLGAFENQALRIPYFGRDSQFLGYGHPQVGCGPTADLTFEIPHRLLNKESA